MEALLTRQLEIFDEIKRIVGNFNKDSAKRKTVDYLAQRLVTLDELWNEYHNNDGILQDYQDKVNQDYFTKGAYEKLKDFYTKQRKIISEYPPFPVPGPSSKTVGESKFTFELPNDEGRRTIPGETLEELLSQQRTGFRALARAIRRVDIERVEEKWEIEDQLKDLQRRWRAIDELHLRIDNILQGSDNAYDMEFSEYEDLYSDIKRRLNRKLSSTVHLQNSTPKVEIPIFSGKYSQWPTFFDLFNETIHSNNGLSKAQKMQYLKGKLRGEAERLIQHLNISADNYLTAWEILTHRYNNPQVLFTNQIETFLNQPNVHKQSSHELKRLHDTTMECIHAIHNLGVDTTTWDPLLVHLICKKLDPETYSDYKESRKAPRDLASLEELMNFIEGKFTALEPINKKERNESGHKPTYQPVQKPFIRSNNQYQPNNQYQLKFKGRNYQSVATFTPKCPICMGEHDLFQCKRFTNMTSENKVGSIAKLEICKNCLYKHYGKPCTSTKRCKYCNDDHNSIIHEDLMQLKTRHMTPRSTPSTSNDGRAKSPSNKKHNVNHVAADDEEILLTTISLKVKAANGTYIKLRALLDQGSQISLLSENAAQILGLQRQRFKASVSGIGVTSKQGRGIVNLECQSIYNDYSFTTQALVISNVISNLPNNTFAKKSWPHIQHINLADPEYNVSRPIDLLLDASIYSDIIMGGLIKGPSQAPIAQQTKMGWILSGNVRRFNCHVVINEVDEMTKFWDVEGINDSTATMTEQEQYCEHFYQATVRRLDSGRYEVALPMKEDFEQNLGTSRSRAVMQFKQLEKRMANNQSLSESYKKFINEYQELRHMQSVDHITSMPTCYLPHHGVLKLDSTTTALRVVFNASSKTSSGHSLNDLMECGPNLQQDLQGLILKWRTQKYVITADIEKMYRQILIRDQDSYLQTIIWRDLPQEALREYRLTTVTYGTKAAPFLAMRTLKEIANNNATEFPLAAKALESEFYMDDLMSGHDTKRQAKELQTQLIEVLKGAGMNLRKWSSNDPELTKDLSANQLNSPFEFKDTESRKTLGLRWNPSADTFTFQNKIEYQKDSNTKRQLLSDISRIYDPLGWLAPVVIKAKILFQRTWLCDMKWDDELPCEILDEWHRLREDLKNIEQFNINRYLGNRQTYQVHGFSDASEKAYACAVYVTSRDDKGEFTSRLVAAKTKLAPHNKQISLPRLELLGAVLLAQLLKKVVESISAKDITITAWTDSMVVLGWIHGDISRWKQFVANRVRQIIDILPASHWHHVKSEDNAADCATRGMTTFALLEHNLWWQGPQWIKEDHQNKPTTTLIEKPNIEIKKQHVNTALQSQEMSIIAQLLQNNSSLTRVVRIVGWVTRFITRLRNKQVTKCSTSQNKNNIMLSTIELQHVMKLILIDIQQREFEDDIYQLKKKGHVRSTSKLSNLNPFLDGDGILRVGGRLEHAPISYSAKHPVILPSQNRLTTLIVNQAHITTLHGGPRLTLSFIRNNYWIIGGVRVVKKLIRLCIKCRRFSQETKYQIMADLPVPRVTPSRPFTNTGVDFTGHIDLKINKGRGIKTTKGYVAVFVCLVTKAVHLELVSDLSTPAFLAAFRRMSARRGTPRHVYSDNGTNFVGANKVLKKEYKAILETIDPTFITSVNEMGVTWHFNAPAWPSAGGLWEAAVKSMKFHLKRVMGEQKLTYEEFSTLLHQIEACMNSRPLCPLTENQDDGCLTPGHFLVGDSLLSRPQTDPDIVNLPARWHLVQSMNRHLWKKWSHEYLQQLQTRSKWRKPTKNVEINDIVIIKEDNMPPGRWALGRVEQLHPGADGYVRVVSLKTQNKIIKRPVNKLVWLPLEDIKQQSVPDAKPVQTTQNAEPPKPKRNLRPRKKAFTHFGSLALLLFMTIISPSLQASTSTYNLTEINDNQNLFFDKISDLRHIRDEWKLIIYYNISTYWSSLSEIKRYVTHLRSSCYAAAQYKSVILQLEHEINEIEHYNELLNYQNKRAKRGLVNGIGYLANSLFGVLDERFAQQYKEDIEKITKNENHIQNLVRNQTLILESENNIIQRNEEIMNRQINFIKNHLKNVSLEMNQIRFDNKNELYITSSALAASIILSNLRKMQETLIDSITDIHHGRIDTHLFSPKQLTKQTNIILSHLHGDLMLPTEDTRQLYKLLKVFARIIENYLIIEVKIPLIGSEVYELDKIISIPQKRGEKLHILKSVYPYIAFDLKKDLAFLLSEVNLQACIHNQKETILCSLDEPLYDLKLRHSICDIKLINTDATTNASPCTSHESECIVDKWIKLQRRNSWLYSCCKECRIRIFSSEGMELKTMTGNGVFNLGQGCTVKGDTFTIYSHMKFLSESFQHAEAIQAPQISVLNKIINSSYSYENEEFTNQVEDHKIQFEKIQTKIEQLKNNTQTELTVHDIHHYISIYIVLTGLVLTITVLALCWRKYNQQPQMGSVKVPGSTKPKLNRSASLDLHQLAPPVEPTRRFSIPSVI